LDVLTATWRTRGEKKRGESKCSVDEVLHPFTGKMQGEDIAQGSLLWGIFYRRPKTAKGGTAETENRKQQKKKDTQTDEPVRKNAVNSPRSEGGRASMKKKQGRTEERPQKRVGGLDIVRITPGRGKQTRRQERSAKKKKPRSELPIARAFEKKSLSRRETKEGEKKKDALLKRINELEGSLRQARDGKTPEPEKKKTVPPME